MSKLQWLWLPAIVIGVVTCRAQEPRTGSTAHHEDKSITDTAPRAAQGVPIPGWKPDPEIEITRTFAGKKRTFAINPNHEGGGSFNAVWEQEVSRGEHETFDRILQLSPTVLCYEEVPGEVAEDFHHISQPMRLEFMDAAQRTIREVDIWNDRPYRDRKELTYWSFDAEGMEVIPYAKQHPRITPTEYSLFTYVQSEGQHVIVNYELRGMYDGYQIVSVQHTLRIYDLLGELQYELKDLSSVDGAVVNNDGRYLMYIFGGTGLATANQPFATIEREGWALMRLADQKIVYREYTDDGKLACDGISLVNGLINIGYATPSTELDYDLMIFFKEKDQTIYKGKLTRNDFIQINEDMNKTGIRDWNPYLLKYNFQRIPITTK